MGKAGGGLGGATLSAQSRTDKGREENSTSALRQHKKRDFSPGSAQGQLCHLCGRCPNTGNMNIVIKKIHVVVFSATTLLGLMQAGKTSMFPEY